MASAMKSAGKRRANSSSFSNGKGNCAPGVEHRLDARGATGAMRARDRHVVDVRAVEVEAREVAPRELAQLGYGTDARVGAAVPTAPARQRVSPVPVARERPVDVVLEPVAEPTVLDVLRVPADR